jgi:hypothetical protein
LERTAARTRRDWLTVGMDVATGTAARYKQPDRPAWSDGRHGLVRVGDCFWDGVPAMPMSGPATPIAQSHKLTTEIEEVGEP